LQQQQQQQQQQHCKDEDDHEGRDEEDALTKAAAAPAGRPPRRAGAPVPPPRRSGREAKARVVYVGRVPVLRDNLYNLEGGEPSVFDKELTGEAGAGAWGTRGGGASVLSDGSRDGPPRARGEARHEEGSGVT
jgi:hypothetical protein